MPSQTPAQTWLVTGGAGFIGSNFVRWALTQRPDLRVVVLDKLTYAGSLENLRDLGDSESRLEFRRGDIADTQTVSDTFAQSRPTQVIHFAAESHVDRSIDGPRAFFETNLRGTFELLETARAFHRELEPKEQSNFRFVQVSTDEVYGSLGPTGYFTEETPYAPNSPYSASKAGGDLLVRAYHQTYGLPALITNCSNNYGPFQFPEKLMPKVILNALEAEPIPIYGDGSNIRDWIYVEDHCAGIARALEAGRPGEQYAFGGRSERSNLQVVDTLCDALEKSRPPAQNKALGARGLASYRDLKEFVADRPGHDQRYAIDSTKAETELGWRAETDFETAVASTVAWYLEHEPWRRAIEREGNERSRIGLEERADTETAR